MNSFRTETSAGTGARLFAGLFFLFFMGLGLTFCWLIFREAAPGLRTWAWTKMPCEISSSEVREVDHRGRKTGNYYVSVRYSYDFNGQSYTSDRYQLKRSEFQDYGQAARLAELYRPESTADCFVNPSAPGQAVLKRGNPLFPLLVLFPLIFVTIGALGIYSVWRPKIVGGQPTQPISEQAVRPAGRSAGAFFFLIFVLMGSAFFYGFFLRPVFKILSARQWPAVPCVVLSSDVRSHSGSHGSTTYSVNILYRYEINGREFKANRYDFMGGSSSGSRHKYDIVAQHPPGSRTICYVNPADATEAVLERGFTPTLWIGLMPLVFVFLGIAGLSGLLGGTRLTVSSKPATLRASEFGLSRSEVVPQPDFFKANEALVLKPSVSPWGKVIAASFFALFWNGIVSVFVIHILKSWHSGPSVWFLALFMVPFVLIGLGILIAVVYFLLALFNPRPRITLTPGAVPLGGTFRIEWAITGRTDVLKRLVIRLEGREEATHQNGKNTATDTNVFASIEIADVTVAQAMSSGDGTVTVPASLMHTLIGSHNKIVWAIRVQGEIAHWPDIGEDFPVTVLPQTIPNREWTSRDSNEQRFQESV